MMGTPEHKEKHREPPSPLPAPLPPTRLPTCSWPRDIKTCTQAGLFFSQPHPVTVSHSCLNMKPLTAPPTCHPRQALQALFLEAVILSADVLM